MNAFKEGVSANVWKNSNKFHSCWIPQYKKNPKTKKKEKKRKEGKDFDSQTPIDEETISILIFFIF